MSFRASSVFSEDISVNPSSVHDSDSDGEAEEQIEATQTAQTTGRKPMGAVLLLETAEKLYRAFNPAQVTLDTHVDRALSETGAQSHNSYDETFIRQVLYGVVRYRQFLGSLMDSFYYYNSGVANRDDRDMYKLLAYLAIFRLEELGFANFRRLLDAQTPQKMVVFFRYLFNESYLQEAVRDDWLKLYDKGFVDDLIAKLLSWKVEMSNILSSLEQTVYMNRNTAPATSGSENGSHHPRELYPSTSAITTVSSSAAGHRDLNHNMSMAASIAGTVQTLTPSQTMVKMTTPKPFNLSQPRPKPLPVEPPPPPPLAIYRSPPKINDGPTKDELAIQAAREENRRAAEERRANATPFKLRVLERPTNLDKIREEIEADIARQLTFQPASRVNPPSGPVVAAVKLNAAAILREDALYRKKQQQEAELIKQYERELRDPSEFNAWQQKVLKMDEAARAELVERRRVEMQELHEAAIRAKERQVEENQAVGRQVKAELKLIEEQREKDKEEDVKVKQAMREAVAETRGNAAAAAEKAAAEKWTQAEEERQKRAQDAKMLAEQQIRDLAEKRDIIMQLRALEKVPKQRFKAFDPTEGPDHGLLDSMPLIELRERLKVVKRRRQEEEEQSRQQILRSKQEKEDMLRAKVANIQRVRKAAASQGVQRREEKVATVQASAARTATKHDDDVLLLHRKLEEKRALSVAEKQRIIHEEMKIKFEQMQQAAGADQVEANKFLELRSGAQREMAARQATKLATATVNEEVKSKATAVRSRNIKAEQAVKTGFLSAYDDKIAALMRTAQSAEMQDSQRKKALATTQRSKELEQRARREEEVMNLSKGHGISMAARLQALSTGRYPQNDEMM